jgi:hypothetical protein
MISPPVLRSIIMRWRWDYTLGSVDVFFMIILFRNPRGTFNFFFNPIRCAFGVPLTSKKISSDANKLLAVVIVPP